MCSVYSRETLDALHEERLPTTSQGPRSEGMNLPAAQHAITLPLLIHERNTKETETLSKHRDI